MIRQAYVCGPYTGTPEQVMENVRAAIAVAQRLADKGWLPIVPHVMGPHDQTWDQAMERCCDLVCGLVPGRDVVVLLPDWWKSRGALQEKALASARGVKTVELSDMEAPA